MVIKQEEYSTGIAMIRIDGAEVRRLRESKGLTQLYLATAVGVTTDTVSRWENGRYASVKKENGLKLALALEVDLEDILEREKKIPEESGAQDNASPDDTLKIVSSEDRAPGGKLKIFILVVFLAVGGLLSWFLLSNRKPVSLQSVRHLPGHSPPGQPFPVLVEIITSGDAPVPLLVKEQLPPEITLLASVPNAASAGIDTIKWLQKRVGEHQRFGYLVKFTGKTSTSVEFAGNASLRKGKKLSVTTEGERKFSPAPYHFADLNRDYRLDDDEILTVYDEFTGLAGFEIGIDEIEEIWMGSGYRWNEAQGQFEILP